MSAEEDHRFYDRRAHGFVRVAASTPAVWTADVARNAAAILSEARKARDAGVDLLLYPELALSSYAIDDLHLQHAVLDAVERELAAIVTASTGLAPVMVVGAPLRRNGRLYNCAAVIAGGKLLGVVPPNSSHYRRAKALSTLSSTLLKALQH